MGFLLYMNTLWIKRQYIVDLLYMYVLWIKRQLIVDLHSCFTIYYGISIVHECIVDQETIHCRLTIHVCIVDQETIRCGLAQLLYYILKRMEKHSRNTIYLLWTQTHCPVDDTVTIEYLHCERHCSTLEAFLSCVFSQELRLGTWPSLPKAVGSGFSSRTQRCWVWLTSQTQNTFKRCQ
jgi:hypothetical protein